MVQRFKLIGITILSILLLTIMGAVSLSPAYAGFPVTTCFPNSSVGCLVSNSGNIEVVAGNSGSNTIALSAVGGLLEAGDIVMFSGNLFSGPPPVGCISGLPTGAACVFARTVVLSVPSLTTSVSSLLTVTTSSTTPPGTYTVTVWVGYVSGVAGIIAPVFSIQQQQFHPEQAFEVFTTQFNLIVDPAPPIPEYPLGLPLLAIFMVISYGLIRRRTSTNEF